MSMFLLLGKSISALGGNSLLGRDLAKLYASDDSARKLASCYDVVMAAEQLMDQISGNTASCSSISSAYFCSVKCTVDTLCCGSICGNLEQKMHFDSSFTPQKESSCVHYSSDSSHGLSGKKRCTYFDYNAYGSVSDCRSTFRSQSCKSCTMCGSNIPGTQIPMATTDCSNIDGGDVLSYECSDVDEMEEMMDLALSCANPSKRPVQNEDLDEVREKKKQGRVPRRSLTTPLMILTSSFYSYCSTGEIPLGRPVTRPEKTTLTGQRPLNQPAPVKNTEMACFSSIAKTNAKLAPTTFAISILSRKLLMSLET